jgi:ABC-type phosphate transport system substrate-binding protein
MWNDPVIVSDQMAHGSATVGTILSKINEKIKVVVRTDTSGTSDVFSGALGLFDPRK